MRVKVILFAIAATMLLGGLSVIQVNPPESTGLLLLLVVVFWMGYLGFLRSGALSLHVGQSPRSRHLGLSRDTQSVEHKLDFLLLLRFIAAAIVFTMHSGIVFNRDFKFGNEWWGFLAYSPAWWGMSLFFTLSGFLMGKSFASGHYSVTVRGVNAYLRNRAVRIFPLMITVAVFITVWQSPHFIDDASLWVKILSFTFDGKYGPPGVAAFWSLSTEFQFYAFVPLVFLLLSLSRKSFGVTKVLLLSIGFVFVALGARQIGWSAFGMGGWDPWIYKPFVENLDAFGLGLVAALVRVRWPRLGRRSLSILWPLPLLASYAIYSGAVAYPMFVNGAAEKQQFFAVVMPGVDAILLTAAIFGCDVFSELRIYENNALYRSGKWALVWAGALTFPVYLVHSSVLFAVQTAFPGFSEPHKILYSVLATLILSIMLNLTIERGAERWRAKASSTIA